MQRVSFQFALRSGTSTIRPGEASAASDSRAAESLAEYAERWLVSVQGGVRSRTFDSYSSQLRLHVLPLLGDRAMSSLSAEDVLELIDRLRGAGYTGWTIRTAMTPLSRLLNHAVRRGVIAVSPISRLDRTERPAVWTAEQKVLKREEIRRLLMAAPPRFRTLISHGYLDRSAPRRAARLNVDRGGLRSGSGEGAELSRPAGSAVGAEDSTRAPGRCADALTWATSARTPGSVELCRGVRLRL